MFVDIDNTEDICVGDILYFKESSRTNPDYWGFSARVEDIDTDGDKYVTITAPNLDVVKKISAYEWNENPDFDGHDVHTEETTNVNRLVRWVEDVNIDSSQELDDFLRSV